MKSLYLGLEISVAVFFLVAGWLAYRRGRLPLLELVSAATFCLLLEEGDQLSFGTYHYSPDFILTIDRAPLVIGLTWALIIAGAMRITDALGVRRRYAPFVDSVLAISLDLGFDAIAIRMGLWTWRGIGPGEGWFGVPAVAARRANGSSFSFHSPPSCSSSPASSRSASCGRSSTRRRAAGCGCSASRSPPSAPSPRTASGAHGAGSRTARGPRCSTCGPRS